MNLRHLLRRHHLLTTTFTRLSTSATTSATTSAAAASHRTISSPNFSNHTLLKHFHSSPSLSTASAAVAVADEEESEDAAEMNEFLSRFAHSMRSKLKESFPHCDKPTIDSMLVIVVDKLVAKMEQHGGAFDAGDDSSAVADDFGNEELSKTVWEVSNTVFRDMEREKKKAMLKKFLQCDQVNYMTRFASEIGVRGDLLRDLRFKWAKEEMEDAEFYEEMKELKEQAAATKDEGNNEVTTDDGDGVRVRKRQGRIKYKLYGLDMSGEKWREVAEKVEVAEELIWPAEAKAITGQCKTVTEKIVSLGTDEDEGRVSELINEWVELLQPTKVDWVALLDNIKSRNYSAFLKMAERVLDEPSFQSDIRDYSQLIVAHAKEGHTEDVERLLEKMSEKGMSPDALTLIALLHLYSKTNNLDRAKEAYKALMSLGLGPDTEIYNSMIKAYVNAGKPKSAAIIIKEMRSKDLKPTEEMYMSVLKAFAQRGDAKEAENIVATMQQDEPIPESFTLLIQACAKSGYLTKARTHFDDLLNLGQLPDDKTTAMLIAAYEKRNQLDDALCLLLQLEKNGFEPGIATYCALVDWFGKMQLIDETEQILAKIAQLGEAPPLKLQVSLCDMYARARIEKKALQALGVLEAKKDELEHGDFERIIRGLLDGRFVNDAKRIEKLMAAQGFTQSENLQLKITATEAFRTGGANNSQETK